MIHFTFPRLLLLAALLTDSTLSASAQKIGQLHTKIKVYLVGTFHFNSSPTDVVKGSLTDMKTNKKQQELDELISCLARTKANKVFVEWKLSEQSFVDSTYALYRHNRFLLRNNEVYQIGYRLANKLNHSRVYCADAAGVFDYDAATEYARTHSQEKILTSAFANSEPDSVGQLIKARLGDKFQLISTLYGVDKPNESILEKLARMNSDEFMRANMDAYLLTLTRVGGGDNYVGTDLGGEFYKRNLRIYTNLLRQVDVQQDKAIILIIGVGHVSFLKQQLQYSSLFEVQDIVPLLKAK